MELILAAAIGVLAASGVYLILRPRTFQVIIGLSLIPVALQGLQMRRARRAPQA